MPRIFSFKDNRESSNNSSERERLDSSEEVSSSGTNYKQKKKESLTIDLSTRTMLFILAILGFIFFSTELISVIVFVFFGFVLMASIRPIVNWLKERGLSKGLAITLPYVLLLVGILGVIILISVPLVNQMTELAKALPEWVEGALASLENFSIGGYSVNVESISPYITEFIKGFPTADNVKNVATFLSDFFGFGAFLVTSIIFSVYLVSEHDTLADIAFIRIVSTEKRDRVKQLVSDVEGKLGSWVLGQGVVSTSVMLFTLVLLSILEVPFALPLAIFTGFINVIPNLGSTISGILMAIVTLIAVNPVSALIVGGSFVIYQLIENSLIVPKVMGNAVGLKPIFVMLGVIIFITFFGLIGGFVAVPLMVIAKILYEFYIDLQKLEAKGIV
ncbi:MAG TPA: AI-2E family transporter [Candidatus Dojkabacteria bacterium]|nr:AI-2E family transporter [Candidatus Dojkabacteria bacterium]